MTTAWNPTDCSLSNGARVHIRRLVAADAPLIEAGFERLSPESREMRFFAPTPRLSPELLEALTHVDQHHHLALIAVQAENPAVGLGVARAIRDLEHPSHAEIAVTVADDLHRRGIGTALLRALRRAALAEGIDAFEGYVLLQNRPALEWLRHAGASIEHDGGGLLRFSISLRRNPTAPLARRASS